MKDIVRLTWYVTDKNQYMTRQHEVGKVYQRILGKHFPAMTMVVVSKSLAERPKFRRKRRKLKHRQKRRKLKHRQPATPLANRKGKSRKRKTKTMTRALVLVS